MCANLVFALYSPRRIVLGSGVMHQEQLYGIVRKTLEYHRWLHQTAELKDMESPHLRPGCGGDKESSARPSWQEGRSRNLRSLRHTTR